MKRFKKEVVIGGIHGRDLDGLVSGIVDVAADADTIHETRIVLKEAMLQLHELAPMSLSEAALFEDC